MLSNIHWLFVVLTWYNVLRTALVYTARFCTLQILPLVLRWFKFQKYISKSMGRLAVYSSTQLLYINTLSIQTDDLLKENLQGSSSYREYIIRLILNHVKRPQYFHVDETEIISSSLKDTEIRKPDQKKLILLWIQFPSTSSN